MTVEQKNEIMRLRDEGQSYTQIADRLMLPRNTVKSYCRRNPAVAPSEKTCLQCGKPLVMIPGKKEKRYCSDACRGRYWNAHAHSLSRESMMEYTCPVCGKTFAAYAYRGRKYCSRECYAQARSGGAE